jgi:hypothetical protein
MKGYHHRLALDTILKLIDKVFSNVIIHSFGSIAR